ncbi:MAG: NYN domain-containing protein [Ruminococcus sp.]|nr:NYN domain-containing protein [Ruminococcus sp.]
MTVDTKDLVATIAYLIGIKKHIVENCFDEECHDTLQKLYNDQNATTIRYLCKLRTTLMQKFKKTDDEMRYNLKNLNRIEWYDAENIAQLEKWGIQIIQPNYRSEKYILDFTRLIAENIEKCRGLFYDWVNWDYIKELFYAPKYNKANVLKKEFDKYMANMEYYPFQMYIHWIPKDYGSILYTDGKFISILYQMHNDHFEDKSKFKDATEDTKSSIYEFIDESYKTAIVVDCENSDVFKLYGVLKNLNQDELSKIEKIILYDDYHTSEGWDWLSKFTKIPVEHIEVERVTDSKSLVDIKLTAGICKIFYQNQIDSFILFSSDSDYWGLISSLPDANFLVMYEYTKCGQAIKDALTQRGVYHCSIDDFCSGNIEEFKKAVLFDALERYIPDIFNINGRELAKKIYSETRVIATEKEIELFYNKYIKTLRLKVDTDGNFKIEIAK